MKGVYHVRIIITISRKYILIDRIFHDRRCQIILWWRNYYDVFGWAVPLPDTLLLTIMEFPRAIQIMSRATRKGFPKRQFFGNRRDNTQRNGEHNCMRFRIWHLVLLDNLHVDWIWNPFWLCPGLNILGQFLTNILDPVAWETECELQSIKL